GMHQPIGVTRAVGFSPKPRETAPEPVGSSQPGNWTSAAARWLLLKNATAPRIRQVQMGKSLPIPPYSPPALSAPRPKVMATPPVARPDHPCRSGTVVRPTVVASSLEK